MPDNTKHLLEQLVTGATLADHPLYFSESEAERAWLASWRLTDGSWMSITDRRRC
ncbi:hypothetical protein [Azospirillum argentinense]|uniref:hypothetical protein n=1 Tax=Azospirillum argentinense TaxID=2970906 RepID=UPI0032DFB70A